MPYKNTRQRWQDAAWSQAITLTERIASLPRNTGEQSAAPLPNLERAQQRLHLWKELPSFKSGTLFSERLASDGLTEEELVSLLGESAEALQARLAVPAEWLTELASAFDGQQADQEITLPLQETGIDAPAVALLNVVKPLLKHGVTRLQIGIGELRQHYAYLPFDPEAILPSLFAHLPTQLLPELNKTVLLELHLARLQGRLQGETPEERFRSFLQDLGQSERLLSLLSEYPVLARQLVETIERWLTCNLELLERLCADWEQICDTFTPAKEPGALVAIHAGVGDTHRGGHSVAILRWSSDFQLVYKPRDLSVEQHFQDLLTWLNACGQEPPLRTLRILNRGVYGWVEFVQAHPCASQEEVERFYQRQGAYLALLYALEATDFHNENLIASGEHPMLIDLESLMQPRPQPYGTLDVGTQTIGQSVLRIGLLPQRLWSNAQAEGVELSALGGHAGQLTPTPVPQWTDRGTDQMRLIRERVELPPNNHRPTLHGQDIDTLGYSEHILNGFAATYQRLLQHRGELLTEVVPRFAQDQVRCLLRPTRDYVLLLRESFHPVMLQDALDRDRFFDRLWTPVEHQPSLSRLIAAERKDLLCGDIPLFTSCPGCCDLFTSRGETIPAFFDEPSLNSVKKRIQQLDERDLERQMWVIRASFTSLSLGTDRPKRSTLHLHPSTATVTTERLFAAAQAVGDHLDELALHHDDAVGWLGVIPVSQREWHLLPAGLDLYNGIPGIALFLAYLGLLTDQERYSVLARSALTTIRSQVEEGRKLSWFGGISPFEGVAAVVYLLSHLGTLWNDPSMYTEAEEIVQLFPDMIAKDETYDLIGGSAGCIAALLSLYSVAPSEQTLARAIQCGDRLIAGAQPMKTGIGWKTKQQEIPLTGLGHGNAGIALNLLRLFTLTKEERFRETACAAIAYERNLFSSKVQNWPDLRDLSNLVRSRKTNDTSKKPQGPSYMVAWCHGAPGIGLARLESRKYIDDAAMEAEIAAAVSTTLSSGFGMNHSLCHGDLGNLELLQIAAAEQHMRPEQNEQIECIIPMLLDSVERQGWVSGVPQGVETPGLMLGLAGTGYAWLRLAAPERVPSVLLLAPPY
ncbi:MAG: type 2 lantipeptide synthetase LanM family protein [Ktedonobacteraceae bacterium]|nr:type 2 lantipeptide synthetase LanM family protein [Ktedonobacteraceae bacterium]